MKQKLNSVRFRILLPVILIVLILTVLLTGAFSRAYISSTLRQENKVNAVSFDTFSRLVTPLIETAIGNARSILADERIVSYARLQFASDAERFKARSDCRDYLAPEITQNGLIHGLLFMRPDGSLFGSLPLGNFFLDDPEQNPLPEALKARILRTPIGQTVWEGPLSESVIYGFEGGAAAKDVMIAAWKNVDARYNECYALMLLDESVFDGLFATLRGGDSTWRLFTADQREFYRTGGDACPDPERLIRESNSGSLFTDEDGRSLLVFSLTMESPGWTLVREVPMDSYNDVVHTVRVTVWHFAGGIILVSILLYHLWLKHFMRQFRSLQNGVVRLGEGDLESTSFVPTSITEFRQMQGEIVRTAAALRDQMDTIRRMEREQAEQEQKKKEQERIERELAMAREIQANALPSVFPAFPDRQEFDLFASMTPAKEMSGDFYDFFLIDSDHLALVIADVSGKGIPAALFMMVSKVLLKNQLLTGSDPETVLRLVNAQLRERNSSMMFVTVWLAVVEISTGKGLACNAGHENPGLRRAGANFELLRYRHDMFVGVSKKAQYHNRAFELQPGDVLFVYTDGIPEAKNSAGEMFGEARLEAALNACAGAGPEEIIRSVKSAVASFTGDAAQFDDLTMVCFEYKG